ncbi:MAG TPA: response regulator [Anaerolineae bacterium]|nr:response regulator [Anaerolineae bacterium]
MRNKGRVLVVDNNPKVLASVGDFLKANGYSVSTADSPQQALKLTQEEIVHLAIIDIRLTDDYDETDVSGLDLAATLDPAIPKIILTAYEDINLIIRSLSPDRRGTALAVDFVLKRLGPYKLLEAVEKAFRSKVRLNTRMEITWEKGLSWRVLVEELKAYRGGDESEKRKAEEELEDLVVRLLDRATALKMLRVISGRGGCGVVIARPSFGRVMGEDMVIKFGPRKTVMAEFANYKRWVEPFAAVRSTQLRGEPVRTPHLGAIKYSFVGERPGRLVHFNDYYLRDNVPVESIAETLRYLFKECCGLWYKSKRKPGDRERIPLDVWYRKQLPFQEKHVKELRDVVEGLVNGEQPLARHFRRQGPDRLEVTLDGETVSLPDPVHFALVAKSSFPVPSLVAITHGDLNGTNILVDGEGKAWLIDFFKTGWGPVLRDLAEMESVVKFELLQTDDLLARYALEKASLWPRSLKHPIQVEYPSRLAGLGRAATVIQQLRALACDVAETDDPREYYTSFLFYALKEMAGFKPRVGAERHFSVGQYHAFLSAAMVCETLERWGSR